MGALEKVDAYLESMGCFIQKRLGGPFLESNDNEFGLSKDVIDSDGIGPAEHSVFWSDLDNVAAAFLDVVDEFSFVGFEVLLAKKLDPIGLSLGHGM